MDRAQKETLARQARRNPSNEATLLWAACAVVLLFLILGLFPASLMDRFSLKINVFGGAIVAGIVLAIVPAVVYYSWATKVVSKAIIENNDVMKQDRDRRAADVSDKMAKMNAQSIKPD